MAQPQEIDGRRPKPLVPSVSRVETRGYLVMLGIIIRDADERDVLTVDLASILEIVGERALASRWRVADVDTTGGEAAEQLYRVSDDRLLIPGRTLLELARGVWQIVDGTFEAYDNDAELPWLIVRAVDSSEWDVLSTDVVVLTELTMAFRDVSEFPESE